MNGKKKLQVFVSSTYIDLIEERQAAVQAILSAGHIPAGMELFSAGDKSQMDVIKKWIDESDVFLLILGGRYGSVEPDSGKSYTHLEYEYAIERGKANFAVVIDKDTLEERVKDIGTEILETKNPLKLEGLRNQVLTQMSSFWKDSKDIKISIFQTLNDFISRENLKGWIRGEGSIDTGIMAEELAKLSKENSQMRKSLDQIRQEQNFNGLSFNELYEMLLSDNVSSIDNAPLSDSENLYEYFMRNGEKLSLGFLEAGYRDDKDIFNQLISYGLVSKDSDRIRTIYTLTREGQKFYLRAKVISLSKDDKTE